MDVHNCSLGSEYDPETDPDLTHARARANELNGDLERLIATSQQAEAAVVRAEEDLIAAQRESALGNIPDTAAVERRLKEARHAAERTFQEKEIARRIVIRQEQLTADLYAQNHRRVSEHYAGQARVVAQQVVDALTEAIMAIRNMNILWESAKDRQVRMPFENFADAWANELCCLYDDSGGASVDKQLSRLFKRARAAGFQAPDPI